MPTKSVLAPCAMGTPEEASFFTHASREANKETKGPMGSPPGSPSTTTQKRKSRKFLPRFNSKESMPTIQLTENMEKLNEIVSDKVFRTNLINMLLANEDDASMKVRFLAAVSEYENLKDKQDKKSKGRKIVGMFVQNGSLFHVKNIPKDYERDLLAEKLESLLPLRNYVLDSLAKDPVIVHAIKSGNFA